MFTLTDTAETFVIDRTGGRKLRFRGWRLAEASGKWHNGQEQNRFEELGAYKTTGGNYVLVEAYITRWQGESNNVSATIYKSKEDFVSAIGGTTSLEKKLLEELGETFEELAVEELA